MIVKQSQFYTYARERRCGAHQCGKVWWILFRAKCTLSIELRTPHALTYRHTDVHIYTQLRPLYTLNASNEHRTAHTNTSNYAYSMGDARVRSSARTFYPRLWYIVMIFWLKSQTCVRCVCVCNELTLLYPLNALHETVLYAVSSIRAHQE